MAKELPYFKFFIGEWITGDITLCSMETQGVFVNLCSYYWSKTGSISLANAKQRFSKYKTSVDQLIFQKIIKLDENENIIINFLDEQINEFLNLSEKRAIAGKKGGKANAKQMLSKAKAKSSNKEKIREDKRREDNIPSFDKFKSYALEKKADVEIESLKLKYEAWIENNWKDGNNKKIINWKSKLLQTIPHLKTNKSKQGKINDIWDK